MKIIDRYILGKFFITFFWCYISLVGFYVLLDLVSNIGAFLGAGTVSDLLTNIPAYYFIDSFVFIDMVFPFLILLSAVTTSAVMDHNNELIALLAMGASPGRILAPIIVGALGASLLFTAIRECYLPARLVEISQKPSEFVQKSDVFPVCRSYDYKTHISIDGEKVLLNSNTIIKPSILLRKNLNTYGNRLTASEGVFLDADNERPDGWLLKDVASPSELLKNKSLMDDKLGEIVIYSPVDYPWLKENEAFVATSLKPIHLVTGENWFQYGSVFELKEALEDPTFKHKSITLAVRTHTRLWRPLTDLLPLFLGVPFIFLRRDKKILTAIMQGMFLAGSYVASQYVSSYLGVKLNNAFIGIWFPCLIFVPLATMFYCELISKNMRQKNKTRVDFEN
ncbi:MAG: LptF/LptG family permease [Thermoguttaceae bacterium]|nr:LptF/LptG family permease [Thermoguttaceae bacterium]